MLQIVHKAAPSRPLVLLEREEGTGKLSEKLTSDLGKARSEAGPPIRGGRWLPSLHGADLLR